MSEADHTSPVRLPDGVEVPALGQGTWQMGERPARRADEIAALRRGVELGLTVIDTAEMYGEGRTEELVGEALTGTAAGQRRDVFLVSKVYPRNAGRRAMRQACERSLKRLGTDRLDLYLLHWRGSVPLAETVEAFEALRRDGLIARWGVSNFDASDMDELWAAGGQACATNQILYSVTVRGPEHALLPWLDGHGVSGMAYSPVGQGTLPGGALDAVAERHGVTRFQVALAFALRRPGMMVIPKAGTRAHVEANAQARSLALDDEDWRALDIGFPPPEGPSPLAML